MAFFFSPFLLPILTDRKEALGDRSAVPLNSDVSRLWLAAETKLWEMDCFPELQLSMVKLLPLNIRWMRPLLWEGEQFLRGNS